LILAGFCITILGLFGLLIKVETKTIFALMANREVGEDEISCL
jgi:hypothetical protein